MKEKKDSYIQVTVRKTVITEEVRCFPVSRFQIQKLCEGSPYHYKNFSICAIDLGKIAHGKTNKDETVKFKVIDICPI